MNEGMLNEEKTNEGKDNKKAAILERLMPLEIAAEMSFN